MAVHSVTGFDLYPVGLMCCEIIIGKSQMKYTFIVSKKLCMKLAIGLDMQQFHCLGCDWTKNR